MQVAIASPGDGGDHTLGLRSPENPGEIMTKYALERKFVLIVKQIPAPHPTTLQQTSRLSLPMM